MGLRDLFNFGRKAGTAPPEPPVPQMTSRQANEMLVQAVEANDIKKATIALKATGSANLKCKYRHMVTVRYDYGPRQYEQADDVALLWHAVLKDSEPMARLLLSYGADVNPTYHGQMPLMHAVCQGATPMVRALLDGGAALREESYPYKTAYEYAKNKQYADIIQMVWEEPARRERVKQEAARAAQEAKAAAEQAAREAEEKARHRAENPTEPVTDNTVVVMKRLSLKPQR
jgi:hypothetical protein